MPKPYHSITCLADCEWCDDCWCHDDAENVARQSDLVEWGHNIKAAPAGNQGLTTTTDKES